TSILPVQAKLSETAKSKILAPLDLRESALPAPGTPPELKNGEEVVEIDEGPVLRTAKISVSETAHPAPKKTAVLDEISKIAMPKTSMASVSPLVRNTKLKNEILPGKNLAQLTVKERLAVTEFKLEARYDRSSARAKLKHMADSFPIGSPAQFEILKAYNGL
ncbi:MAG: hypothetical protein NTV34_11265, partial [Proteobacteria bacterium]|nr:hypothetical protein [Pseudomonadota bacterium]